MDRLGKRKVVVADICNTLFDSNTTYDFIKYCIRTGRLSPINRHIYNILLSRKSPLYWLIAINEKVFKKDLFKVLVVKFLKGCKVDAVQKWSDDFFNDYLTKRAISPTLLLLKNFNSADVILISSTLRPIAASIAKNIGFANFLATELEVENNVYTGNIQHELSGRKLEALRIYAGAGVDVDVVISDNYTDLELMKYSRESYAVCYNEKQEKFWSQLPQVSILKIAPETLYIDK